MSERLVRYYQSHGIITGYAAGHAPSSNGIAEYYNQSGMETLLTNAKLPKDYWITHSSIETTPIEKLFNTKPLSID
ncbi:hypothetical protein E3Q11_03519 [Wallemia mellicola]|nr:hypothetical protein E3Q11_03519 [Wallemia mellicola]